MSDRGMKKWVAFKALVEQTTALSKMTLNKRKIDKPLISNERAEKINSILSNYQNEEVILTYYEDGVLYEIKSEILKINPLEKYILISNRKRIDFKNIINLDFSNNIDF